MEIKYSSELLNTVLHNIRDAVIVADTDHKIVYMNRPAEGLLDTRIEIVAGTAADKLLLFRNPFNGLTPPEWDLNRIDNKKETSFECYLGTIGRNCRLQVCLSRIEYRPSDKLFDGFLIVMRDISRVGSTEKIFAKIAGSVTAEVGETFFHSLTKNLTEILDVDYCLLGEFQVQEPGICTILSSYARQDVAAFDTESDLMDSAPAKGAFNSGKIVCIPKNAGNKFPDDPFLKKWHIKGYAAAPLTSTGGKITGILVVMSRRNFEEPKILKSALQILAQRAAGEIERRKYEFQILSERNRADEMNALKNNFLTNISHEVRTPLNSIIGFSNLLKEDINGELHLRYLRYIEEGGYQLLQTIDAILDLSVLETNPQSIELQKTDLEAELDSALGFYGSAARDKNILLRKIVKAPEVIVSESPGMIGQVLRKLIENSLKFTDSGTVLVSLDTSIRNDRHYGVIQISDTGIGIDSIFLPQIFDEFKQESRGLGRKYEGVGLGLTIVKKMMDLMGGFIEVNSKKDSGTVFTVYFPINS